MGFFVLLRCLITTRGGIKSVFDGFIALIYQEGERWWWDAAIPVIPARHTTTPWTAITGAQQQAVDKGFPSSSIWLPGKQSRQPHGSHRSRPWLWHTGKGLGDCLGCSVLVSVRFAFDGTWISLPKACCWYLLSPVLPRAFCCHQTTISKFLKWKFGPHKPHLSPTQKDDPKVCTCGFKDEPRDAALAKTCLMFNRAVFLWIFS